MDIFIWEELMKWIKELVDDTDLCLIDIISKQLMGPSRKLQHVAQRIKPF